MHPILISIGPLGLHSYGVMVSLGCLAAVLVSVYFAKKEGVRPDVILDLAIYVILSSVFGARLFYVLGQWNDYKNNPLDIIMVQKGGLVILGGMLFSLAVIVWFARKRGIPALKLLDVVAPGVALGIAVGRIGCFLNGCCFGLPTRLPWGVKFPFGSLAYSYCPDEALHPTQLYSMAEMLIVFLILFFLYRRKNFDGFIIYWGLILYSIARFLVEFLRYSPMHWLGLTPSQWIVMAMAAAAIYGLITAQRRSARSPRDP